MNDKNNNSKENNSLEEKDIITSTMEKIGILPKEEEKKETEEKKSLNERIEDLVLQLEKVNKIVSKEFSLNIP